MAPFRTYKRNGKKEYSPSEIQTRNVHQDNRLRIQATVLEAILEIPLFLPSLVINQRLLRVFSPVEQVFRLGQVKTSKGS